MCLLCDVITVDPMKYVSVCGYNISPAAGCCERGDGISSFVKGVRASTRCATADTSGRTLPYYIVLSIDSVIK